MTVKSAVLFAGGELIAVNIAREPGEEVGVNVLVVVIHPGNCVDPDLLLLGRQVGEGNAHLILGNLGGGIKLVVVGFDTGFGDKPIAVDEGLLLLGAQAVPQEERITPGEQWKEWKVFTK